MPHGRLMGARLSDFVAEGDQPAFGALMAKDAGEVELKLRASNGHHSVMLASMSALEGHKLFIFTDITERKRHQAFDDLTRKFLGMMAHEFRNILAPVSNSVEVLKHSPGLDADARKAVELIERQADRMLALVEDLRRINPRE